MKHLGQRNKWRQKSVRMSRVIWTKCYNIAVMDDGRSCLVEAVYTLFDCVADGDDARSAADVTEMQ